MPTRLTGLHDSFGLEKNVQRNSEVLEAATTLRYHELLTQEAG